MMGRRRSAEAMACVRKYFSIASLFILFFWLARMGMNDSMLISNPIQTENQDEDETVIVIPRIITAINTIWVGIYFGLAWMGPLKLEVICTTERRIISRKIAAIIVIVMSWKNSFIMVVWGAESTVGSARGLVGRAILMTITVAAIAISVIFGLKV